MTESQELELRRSKVRERLGEIAALDGDARTDEIRTEERQLQTEYSDLEVRFRSALIAEDREAEDVKDEHGGDTANREAAEFRALENCVSVRACIANRMGGFGSATPRKLNLAGGAELEYNQALNLSADRVPLRLFAGAEPEERTKTDTDTTMRPRRWADRLFADTVAE